MITVALHVLVIGALGVLVRRAVTAAPAVWRLASVVTGAAVAVVTLDLTQARVHAATTGLGDRADMVAAAGPAGDFAGAVLLAMTVVLALPRVRAMLAGNGATPLECCAANDLNHRP